MPHQDRVREDLLDPQARFRIREYVVYRCSVQGGETRHLPRTATALLDLFRLPFPNLIARQTLTELIEKG